MKHTYPRMPTFLHLFGIFWTRVVLQNICNETNWYARVVEEEKRNGGDDWYDVDEKELKTFFVVSLYMGMEQQSYVNSYWAKLEKLFLLPLHFKTPNTKKIFGIAKMPAHHQTMCKC